MKKIWIILSLIIFFISGCEVSEEHKIPEHIKKIYIPVFKNLTYEYGIEERLTEEVIKQFLSDGRVTVCDNPQEADGIIYGKITQYIKQPLQYDANEEPLLYRIRIYIEVEFYDTFRHKIIWTEDSIDRYTTYSDKVEPIETEKEAQDRIFQELAVDVLTRTLEGWANIIQ